MWPRASSVPETRGEPMAVVTTSSIRRPTTLTGSRPINKTRSSSGAKGTLIAFLDPVTSQDFLEHPRIPLIFGMQIGVFRDDRRRELETLKQFLLSLAESESNFSNCRPVVRKWGLAPSHFAFGDCLLFADGACPLFRTRHGIWPHTLGRTLEPRVDLGHTWRVVCGHFCPVSTALRSSPVSFQSKAPIQ